MEAFPSEGFGIQDTFDLGAGNQELIKDLMSPETSLENPENIEKIETPPPPEKKEPIKKQESPSEEEDTPAPVNVLADFFGKDEEEEEDIPAPTKSKKESEEIKQQQEEEPEKEEGFNQFTALYKDLKRLGVFTEGDEEEEEIPISNADEFLQKFNDEKKKGAFQMIDNFLGQFGEDYRAAFDAIFVKGANPKEYFGTYNNVVSFAELDLEDENNQVAVMKTALKDQGFEDEDITTEIERLKNYGDLDSVAKRHHKVLVKKEAIKLQQIQEEAEEAQKAKLYMKQQFANSVQTVLQEKLKAKEFDGIPINPKLANELQDFLLVDKYKTSSGETLTDFDRVILELKRPENHATKVKVALLLKIMEKDPTLSTIQRAGVSKQSNELFSEVARYAKKSNTSPGTKTGSWFL